MNNLNLQNLFVDPEERSYDEAIKFCQNQNDSTIASIKSKFDANLVCKHFDLSWLRLGLRLNKRGIWQWTDGSEYQENQIKIDYDRCDSNSCEVIYRCKSGITYKYDECWVDKFFCRKIPLNNITTTPSADDNSTNNIIKGDKERSYDDAVVYCDNINTRMAAIKSESEAKQLCELFNLNKPPWFSTMATIKGNTLIILYIYIYNKQNSLNLLSFLL